MKRCPQCNRVESDDALAFCRVDGARLVGSSSDLEASATLPLSRLRRSDALPTQTLQSASSSIAVLPFVNMSADAENEYFCDGLAEELINALTKLEGLRVMARTSAFSFKGKEVDVREIGCRLNVATVLEGSVQKAGKRVRITAQLIDVADGFHLWSERYDRDLEDIFAIQDEITGAIAETLSIKLKGRAPMREARGGAENVEAYNLYLKGRFCRNKMTPESFREGITHYEQALEQEPAYAAAYAGLAEIYTLMGILGWVLADVAWPKAKEAARKALDLNQTLAAAHAVFGAAAWVYDRDWEAAERAFLRAIEENAAYPFTYEYYGFFLICLQRYEEGLRSLKMLRDLDPLSSSANALYGCGLWYAGRYEDAIAQCKVALQMDPQQLWALWGLGLSYEQTGSYPEAIATFQAACKLGPMQAWLAHAYARAGRRADAAKVLEELEARAEQTNVWAFEFALVHVGLGNKIAALDYLEKAVDERNVSHLEAAHAFPQFEPLRSELRFREFVRRLGFEP